MKGAIDIDALLREVQGGVEPGHASEELPGERKARGSTVRDFTPARKTVARSLPYTWASADYLLPDEAFDSDACAEGGAAEASILQRISGSIGCRPIALDGFLAERAAWLDAHLKLNREGRLAPRFRPHPDPRQTPSTLAQATFACDRQVIDLHWLYCTGQHLRITQAEYADLLTDSYFDTSLAADFARANVTAQHKAEVWLTLSEREQWQLSSLQSTAIRKRWATIRWGEARGTPGLPQVMAALRGVRRTSEPAAIEEAAMRWAVEKMLPGAPSSARAELFAFARGLPKKPPHIFQRQQDAALQKIGTALKVGCS